VPSVQTDRIEEEKETETKKTIIVITTNGVDITISIVDMRISTGEITTTIPIITTGMQ
jgi:hypothetical protein